MVNSQLLVVNGKKGASIVAKGDNIEERLIDFAVRVVKVCDSLPQTYAGRHLANQLLRSGTSAAANYAEARGGESVNDFIHKLKICLKELNETSVWLRIITRSDLFPEHKMNNLLQECQELARIINASISTTKSRPTTR
jgi:four helix bundle protein